MRFGHVDVIPAIDGSRQLRQCPIVNRKRCLTTPAFRGTVPDMRANRKIGYLGPLFLFVFSSLTAQIKQSELPPELRAEDSELRALLDKATTALHTGDSDGVSAILGQALMECTARKLRRDCALVHGANSAAQLAAGKFDAAKAQLQQSLEIAIDIGDLALEAEFLDSIGTLTLVSGDPKGAISIWTDALAKARAGKTLYVQSEIEGNLARQHFYMGDLKEAEGDLDDALQIDELNGYGLKRIHNVYKAYSLLTKTDPNATKSDPTLNAALKLLFEARDASHLAEDWYTEKLAAQAIAAIYAKTGRLPDALAEVAKVSSKSGPPLAQIVDLEDVALLLEVGAKQDEAIQKWQELHDLAVRVNNDVIISEANTHAAALLVQQNRFEDAVSKYKENLEIAVRRKNNPAVVQALGSLTQLIQQHPEISSVAPFYEQMLSTIRENSGDNAEGTILTFSTLVQLGNEYKRLKQFDKADRAFRSAELLDPDTLDKLGNSPSNKQKLVELLHVQHAITLDALHDQLGALLQAYRAFDSATKAEDKTMYDPIVSDINRWLNADEPYGRVQHLLSNKQPWDALRLAEGLFLEESWNEKWREAHTDQAKQTIPSALSSLDQMASIKEAPAMLEGNYYDIPPEFTGLRLFIARKTAQLLLFRDGKFHEAEKFLRIAASTHDPGSERAVFEAQCWMALAKGSMGDGEGAVEWANKCSASASNLDGEAQRYAHTVEWYAKLSNFAVPGPEAVAAVIKMLGDKPELREKLAQAYAFNNDLHAAIGEAERAVQLFKNQEKYAEGANEALYCSFLTRQLGPSELTTKYVELARELFAKSSDKDGTAKVLLEESLLLQAKGDTARAISAARRAQDHSDPRATTTNIRATLLLAQLMSPAQPAKATLLLQQAVGDADAVKDHSLEVDALIALADALAQQSRNTEALATLKKAEDISKLNPKTLESYSTAMAAGYFYEKTGDMQAALAAYVRAEIAANNSPVQQGFALIRQGATLEVLGDWQGALAAANKAIDRFKVRNYNMGIVWALGEVLSVYVDRGSDLQNFKKAKDVYDSALSLDSKARASLGTDIIEMYLQQADYARAISEAQDRLKDCHSDDPNCRASLQISLAQAYMGAGELDSALAELQKEKNYVQKRGDAYLQGRWKYFTAKLSFARGRYKEATQQFREVCDLVSSVGEGSADYGVRIRSNYSYVFDDLLNSLREEFKSGNSDAAWTALDYADREDSGTFDVRWRRLFVSRLEQQLPPSLHDRESEMTTRIANLKRRLAVAGQGQSVLDLQTALSATNRERDDFVSEVRKLAPHYASIAYPKPLSKGDIRLLNGDMLLRIHVAPTAVYEWITTPGSDANPLEFYSFPIDRQKLRLLVQEIKTAFDQGRPDLLKRETLQQISSLVMSAEVSAKVASAKRLIYIPDDCLFLIPLEMLLWNGDKVPEVAISYYPSVRDFVSWRGTAPNQRTWAKAFVGFADPITADDDPRLLSLKQVSGAPSDPAQNNDIARRGISLSRIPGTADEVNSIGKLFDSAHEANEVYLGFDATKSRVLHTDLTPFRYVHFATHGLLPGDARIDEPALVMSRDSKGNDMLLGMSEVLNLRLNADLVVLSACNTGSGKLAKGEGVMNLGKAFMSAGSSSVAMSLWQVSDVSTSLLMHAFYEELLAGKPKPVALALARKKVHSNGYTNPFFWAPFILVGE